MAKITIGKFISHNGDGTVNYEVQFADGTTIQDLLNFAVSNPEHWGKIRIASPAVNGVAMYGFKSGKYAIARQHHMLNGAWSELSIIKRLNCTGNYGYMHYTAIIDVNPYV